MGSLVKLTQFQALAAVNVHGLVAMEVVAPFAPFSAGDIAGFPPEVAHDLFVSGDATPLEVIEADDDDDEAGAGGEPDAAVEIPSDWQGLHHLKRIKLAGEISGRRATSKEEADEIIAAEVARRADASPAE